MEIVLATRNAGKVRELQTMLEDTPYQVVPQSALACPEVPETGLTFVENALIKARHAALYTGRPAIADDSGLACEALAGAPGIYSARYAGVDASDADNIDRLLHAMRLIPADGRRCRFICVIVFLSHPLDPCPIIAQGSWDGGVTQIARGEGGFGYDPIFEVPGTGMTAAQISPAEKIRLSHRGAALRSLVERLAQREMSTQPPPASHA